MICIFCCWCLLSFVWYWICFCWNWLRLLMSFLVLVSFLIWVFLLRMLIVLILLCWGLFIVLFRSCLLMWLSMYLGRWWFCVYVEIFEMELVLMWWMVILVDGLVGWVFIFVGLGGLLSVLSYLGVVFIMVLMIICFMFMWIFCGSDNYFCLFLIDYSGVVMDCKW